MELYATLIVSVKNNFLMDWTALLLPTQTGLSESCVLQLATNPVEHSHLYDPTVLLQT